MKTCPFCGSEPAITWAGVRCVNCKVGPMSEEKWETRVEEVRKEKLPVSGQKRQLKLSSV